MPYLRDNAITLLESTSGVDLNGAGGTETGLYTVPVGKTCLVTHIVIHTLSDDALASVVTFGKTGGACDEFRGDQTLSGLSAAGKYTTIYLDQAVNDTPEAADEFDAGDEVGIEITTPAGAACTATIDIFGYLI
jgi:hypothetical protein